MSSLPELTAIDDGTTVIVSRGSVEVLVARVDYEAWLKHLTEYVLSRPLQWIAGLEPFVSQHWSVQHAVIREAYRGLAEVAFECENLLLIPEMLQVIGMMIRHCRTLLPERQLPKSSSRPERSGVAGSRLTRAGYAGTT